MAAVSLKCLHQITNKWCDIEWHHGENHDILLNYPAASKKTHVGQGFSKFQGLSQISWLLLSGDAVYQHDFSWLYDSPKYLAALIQLKGKQKQKQKDWGLCPVFLPWLIQCEVPPGFQPLCPHQPSHSSSQKSQGGICSSWEVMGIF